MITKTAQIVENNFVEKEFMLPQLLVGCLPLLQLLFTFSVYLIWFIFLQGRRMQAMIYYLAGTIQSRHLITSSIIIV